MDVILGASIIAAFLAGMVALFAPCCITVLLPSYLASAFRDKKQIVKMTFIFFAGISVVLVPIGLGAAALARMFRDFHSELYIIGGILMLAFAVFSILGKNMKLIPMPKRFAPKGDLSHPKSVFALGIFSGAATSCCAPVLAGAVTLAAISGTFWKALIVIFSYVFGMVFPLFVTAYFYDRFKLGESKLIKGKIFKVKVGKKELLVHSTNLFAGVIFLVMGITLFVLAFYGDAFWSPSYQVAVGSALNRWSEGALGALRTIPEFVWGTAILGAFLFFVYKSKKNNKT